MAVQFKIAARALRQIGAELISSDEIALNELIKNSFDAGSPSVAIHFVNPIPLSVTDELIKQTQKGKITRTEASNALELHINNTFHRDEQKSEKQKSLVLLRKHLSGTKNLAEALDSFRNEANYIRISDTGAGMSKSQLENVFLVIGTPSKLVAKSELKEEDKPILGEKGIGRLSMMRLGNLASVKSTNGNGWSEISFIWSKFDDPDLYLNDINVDVNRITGPAPSIPHGTIIEITQLSADWTEEKVSNFVRQYLRRVQDPFKRGSKYPVDIYLNAKKEPIGGLPSWLKKAAQFSAKYTFTPQNLTSKTTLLRREIQWHNSNSVEIREWSLETLATQLETTPDTIECIGPWELNCLWFNRQKVKGEGVDRSAKDILDELNIWCGGIAIYRDGFRIGKTGGMENDWLEWDQRALKSKGYTLNRYQTIGSLSISSKHNKRLIDTANRENLVSTEEFEITKKILSEILVYDLRTHINTVQEIEVKKQISVETAENSAKAAETSLSRALSNIKIIEKTIPAENKQQFLEIKDAVRGQIDYVKTLKKTFEFAQEKRIELLELAGIGLVIEKAIHELDRITERTAELLDAAEKDTSDGSATKLLSRLRAQVTATNKRIRSVNALSPSGRNKKEEFDVLVEIRNLIETYSARSERMNIEFILNSEHPEEQQPFILRGSKGLLAQVMENLFTNSIYWLDQGLKAGETSRKIWVDTDSRARVVLVRDNGPGIDKSYQQEIFKPYFTSRKKGKGLGLYIASELAEYHGGKLYLSSAEDDDGRLREFILEIPLQSL